MNITKEQYARIEKYFPVQRGNVKIDNCTFINAILYIAENGCKWRALPEKYGKWNSIYQRFKRWCENGVIRRIFNALQQEKIIAIKVQVLALDSTSCKLHPDAHGALKNTDNNVSGNQRRMEYQASRVSANDKVIIEMHLSGGNCHDAPQGRISIET